MLHGAQFGTDIVEPNPPFMWWVSIVPAAAAEALGAPMIATLRVFIALVAAGSLVAADRLLAGTTSLPRRIAFLAVAAYLFTFATHRDLGQREHFTVLLILPYVLAVALRMEGRSVEFMAGFAIGFAAGIGLSFKPYFLLIPLFLEATLLWKTRAPQLLARPEALGAVAVAVLFATATLLLARPWLFEVVPDVQRIYWAFDSTLGSQWVSLAAKFVLPLLATVLVLFAEPPSHAKALLITGAGFAGAAILQGKYYTYHVYAIYVMLVLGAVAGFPGRPGRRAKILGLIFVGIFLQNLKETGGRMLSLSEHGGFGKNVGEVIALVAENSPKDGSFLAVSTHNFPAFPTALYADRRYASTTNSQFYLPAVVRLRLSREPVDPELLAFAEIKARAAILHDLALRPDVVLIDQRSYRHAIGRAQFDFLQFYLEDPRFRTAWTQYRRIEPAPRGFAAYIRVRN